MKNKKRKHEAATPHVHKLEDPRFSRFSPSCKMNIANKKNSDAPIYTQADIIHRNTYWEVYSIAKFENLEHWYQISLHLCTDLHYKEPTSCNIFKILVNTNTELKYTVLSRLIARVPNTKYLNELETSYRELMVSRLPTITSLTCRLVIMVISFVWWKSKVIFLQQKTFQKS